MGTIDLHGLKHEEVGSTLDSFIWENMKIKASAVKIITGNSDEMKKIVYDIANEYNFTIEESLTNSGTLIMCLA